MAYLGETVFKGFSQGAGLAELETQQLRRKSEDERKERLAGYLGAYAGGDPGMLPKIAGMGPEGIKAAGVFGAVQAQELQNKEKRRSMLMQKFGRAFQTIQGMPAAQQDQGRQALIGAAVQEKAIPEQVADQLSTMAQQDPDEFDQRMGTFFGIKDPKQSAFREKVSALQAQGLEEDIAVGIAAGQFVSSRDPITNEVVIVDKATGAPVGDRAPAAGADNVSRETIPSEAAAVAEPGPTTPDITEALGASGFAQSSVNSIVDFFGGKLPFAETSEASALLDNLNLETLQLASSGLGGRPNVFFQEKVAELLVEPAALFSGQEKSFDRFEALSKTFTQEADRLQRDLDTKKMRPATKDESQQRISELRSLASKYDAIIESGKTEELPPLESFMK